MFKNIIILAGGKSTRFFPLDDKNLYYFLGKPLLEHQIIKFLPFAKHIFVVAHERNCKYVEHITEKYSNTILIIQKGEGQASALLSCTDFIHGESLVVNNCDIFNETSLFPSIEKMKKTDKLILTAKKMTDYFPGGYLQFDKNKLTKLVEKPRPEDRPSDMVRLVVDYFADINEFIDVLQKVPEPHKDGVYEKALNNYISLVPTNYIEYSDEWCYLKYPWHVLTVKDHFLRKIKEYRGKNVSIDKSAIITGEAYIDDNVKIHEYSKIVGPCFIGSGTVVGNYAMIRESMVGSDCVIGGYTEVTRTYIGDRVWLHRNYVGDSVFENDILCGSGMVSANYRFDKDEIASPVKGVTVHTGHKKLGAIVGSCVTIGINTSLMPGVKTSPYTIIMPHSLIQKDI